MGPRKGPHPRPGAGSATLPTMEDLSSLVADWPVDRVAVGVTDADRSLGLAGDPNWVTAVASVSKLLVGMAALVAWEEETIDLDEPAGPEGSTVRHLLAHASGLAFDDDRQLARPGSRRIYSNVGIDLFSRYLAAKAGMDFSDYLRQAVLDPLDMSSTVLKGPPSHGIWSNVADLLRFGRELLRPTLVHPDTLAEATRPQFPELKGVLPGIGSFDPNPWGLTFEIRDAKHPHWTGGRNSPATFGHFGGSGTFLWVDPEAGLATVCLTDRDFDLWALRVWPELSDRVLETFAA